MKYRVCDITEIPPGEKRAYTVKNVSLIVVHSQQGEFYAIYDRCPHQHASLNDGVLCGVTSAAQPGDTFEYTREAEIIRCPWHGFSFDVTTGHCMNAPEFRVRTYPLSIHQSQLFLDL
jgi:3-phenylpropionate/trans-cinnamate dioxygenase ferredoxin subunit